MSWNKSPWNEIKRWRSAAGAGMLLMATIASPGAEPVKHAFLGAGGEALPPVGWVEFCERYRGECDSRRIDGEIMTLDENRWKQLVRVNSAVNTEIEPVTDMEQWKVPEHWDYPTTGKGDCEDFVLEKRKRLTAMGWPRSSLLITVVRDKKGEGHAVMTVRTDRGDFVIDNQVNKILLWSDTGYIFVKRQSPLNQNRWLSLGNIDTRQYTAAR